MEHPEIPMAPVPNIPLNKSDDKVDVVIEIEEAHRELVRDIKLFQLSIRISKE